MNKTSSLRARLLGTSALAAFGSVLLGLGSASATPAVSCTGLPPSAGGSVVCSGTSYYSLQADLDNLTVTLNPSAEVRSHYDPAILLSGDNNALVLQDHSRLYSYGNTYAVGVSGDNSTVTLNGGSEITLRTYGDGDKYAALALGGTGSKVTLNGGSSINVIRGTYGEGGSGKYLGAAVYGADHTITLNGGSSINVIGNEYGDGGKYVGAVVVGSDQTVTLNGGSSINVTGSQHGDGGKYIGIAAFGSGQAVTLNGSSINVTSGGGMLAGVVMYNAGSSDTPSSITLNAGSAINVVGTGSGDSKYIGIMAVGASSAPTLAFVGPGDNKYAPSVTLNSSTISVSGSGYNGKYVGVASMGDRGNVTLNGDSAITLTGGSDGHYFGIRTIGDSTTITLNDTSSINVGSYRAKYSVGIAASGDNASITLNGHASIRSVSDKYSVGIFLYNGSGSTVTLNDHASVVSTSYKYGSSGIDVFGSSNSTVTLNGHASVESYGGSGIHVRNSNDVAIVVGRDASVYGRVGISTQSSIRTDVYVAGTVGGWDGTAISFNSNSNNTNTLTLDTGANILGDIEGNGRDSLVLQGHGTLYSYVDGFRDLDVNADGIWDLRGDVDLNSGLVELNTGTLAVNGNLYADTVNVAAGATLGGSGTIYGNIYNSGAISPGNSPGILNVVGSVTFNPGSTFIFQTDGTNSDLLDVTGTVTINGGTVVPEFIGGVDGFVGDIITASGGVTGTFSNALGGSINYPTPGVVALTAVSPASINGGVSGGANSGFAFLDAVLGQSENNIGRGKGLWGTGLWQSADREADGATRGFSQHSQGGAIGGDVLQSGGFTLGVAAGYLDSTVTTQGGGTRTKIDGYNAALYGAYTMGNTFLAGAVTGAYQDQDVRRNVLSGGTVVAAQGSPKAWLGGAGLAVGHVIPIQGSWTLTPKATIAWQHASRDGYTETGGGLGAMSVDKVSSDTVRGLVGAELGLTIRDPNAGWAVRPAIRAGLAQEWRSGDQTVSGTFTATGSGFTAALDNRDQTYLAVGAGVDVTIGGGLTAFASYDGGFGGDVEKTGGVRVGARLEW